MYKVGKVIDSDILEEMAEECLSRIWGSNQSKVTGNNPYSDVRTSKTFQSHYRLYPEFCEQLEDWVGMGCKVSQLDLLLYEEGDKFKIHLDESSDDSFRRYWSTTTVLRLSDDFVGEGLRIYGDDPKNKYSIPRQEVGDTVIFRSNLWHEASPVEKGTRIVAVAWLDYPKL
jgi:Rps23 Pro-64 3,4-dihydroxylase Tpa1-like proline 4-hydroxylase